MSMKEGVFSPIKNKLLNKNLQTQLDNKSIKRPSQDLWYLRLT